jgi:glutamate 5-kinase
MTNQEIIVVKYGSSSVTNEHGMDELRVEGYVEQLADLNESYGLIVVSSGSIAVGMTVWEAINPGQRYPEEQPLAMLGSAGSFSAWQDSFRRRNIPAGQLLVSHREIDDTREGPMLKRVLNYNLAAGIVTIANENDAVSDVEIKRKSYGGDNDGLASRLARFIQARYLFLMTDKEGVLDENDSLIREVTGDNIAAACLAAGGPNNKGRGGMYQKVKAAHSAARKGTDAFIGHADSDIKSMIDRKTGTRFVAKTKVSVE